MSGCGPELNTTGAGRRPTDGQTADFDPTETLAVHCGKGFHDYQCAGLNRYDAVT
jgi:hypothetical protein